MVYVDGEQHSWDEFITCQKEDGDSHNFHDVFLPARLEPDLVNLNQGFPCLTWYTRDRPESENLKALTLIQPHSIFASLIQPHSIFAPFPSYVAREFSIHLQLMRQTISWSTWSLNYSFPLPAFKTDLRRELGVIATGYSMGRTSTNRLIQLMNLC